MPGNKSDNMNQSLCIPEKNISNIGIIPDLINIGFNDIAKSSSVNQWLILNEHVANS